MRPMLPAMRVENELPAELVSCCKDCRKIVPTMPVGRKYVYRCSVCQTKNVAFGTLKSIKNFYRVAEGDQAPPVMSEAEKKALNADKL